MYGSVGEYYLAMSAVTMDSGRARRRAEGGVVELQRGVNGGIVRRGGVSTQSYDDMQGLLLLTFVDNMSLYCFKISLKDLKRAI